MTTVSKTADCLRLQNSLSSFIARCKLNSMSINIKKCSVITFARKRSPILFDYKIADSLVPRTNSVRYLGVQLDMSSVFILVRNLVLSYGGLEPLVRPMSSEFIFVRNLVLSYGGQHG